MTVTRWRTLRTLITLGCFLIGTLILWRTFAPRAPGAAQLATPSPAAGVNVPMVVVSAPTLAPELVTLAPTEQPTTTPVPTALPLPTIAGVRPLSINDCPADHLVKGNIVDRGATKGEKIFHLPGDNGYTATDPERCFVDSKEAELAGYRAVK